jgi:predicted alpha/beta-fold hydrolase
VALGIGTLVALTLHIKEWRKHWEMPKVRAGAGEMMQNVLERCHKLNHIYRPSLVCTHAKAQFMVQWLMNRVYGDHWNYFEAEQFVLRDGQKASLMWLKESLRDGDPNNTDDDDDRPILALLYGVTGMPGNLVPWAKAAYKMSGWKVVVINRRGHTSPLTVPTFNIAGCLDDMACGVYHIQQHHPKSRLYCMGSSAGSGMVARYCDDPESCQFAASVAISCGFDFRGCIEAMNTTVSAALANMVRRFFMFRNKSLLEDQPFWKPLLEAKDLKEFISHMHNVTGHKSEEEYYDEHSADLQKPTAPVMFINAYDDPVFHGSFTFQHEKFAEVNPNAVFVQVNKGGHMTFYTGIAHLWAVEVGMQFLMAHHEEWLLQQAQKSQEGSEGGPKAQAA